MMKDEKDRGETGTYPNSARENAMKHKIEIKYITVTAENVEQESEVFIDILGFEPTGALELRADFRCKLFSHHEQDLYVALIPEHGWGRNFVIFNTKNCLMSYHEMRTIGVSFLAEPYYVTSGLVAEFEDNTGNRFVLLEERCNRCTQN